MSTFSSKNSGVFQRAILSLSLCFSNVDNLLSNLSDFVAKSLDVIVTRYSVSTDDELGDL